MFSKRRKPGNKRYYDFVLILTKDDKTVVKYYPSSYPTGLALSGIGRAYEDVIASKDVTLNVFYDTSDDFKVWLNGLGKKEKKTVDALLKNPEFYHGIVEYSPGADAPAYFYLKEKLSRLEIIEIYYRYKGFDFLSFEAYPHEPAEYFLNRIEKETKGKVSRQIIEKGFSNPL